MAFCQNCGAEISDKAVICVKCGVPVPGKYNSSKTRDDAYLRLVIPIDCSPWAVAAGYLGLLSLIPFVGIVAIILGILAIRDVKLHPDRHGLGRAWFGIIMGALSLLFYLLVIVLSCV